MITKKIPLSTIKSFVTTFACVGNFIYIFCSFVNLNNYFINSKFKAFPENDLKNDPKSYVYETPEYLGTLRSMKILDSSEENTLKSLLGTLNSYYARRNLDILERFRDFDRNNIGVLTESQVII